MGVKRIFGHELRVCADCTQSTGFQHRDTIRVFYRREAMGDHQTGSPGHQVPKGRLHLLFALGIQAAGGLIEQQQCRISQ